MVDIRLLQKLLSMPREKLGELLKDDPVYQKHSHILDSSKEKRAINLELEKKIEGSVDDNLLAYLSIKEDVNRVMDLADAYLGKFAKQRYWEALNMAAQEKDPAESFRMLGEICTQIRQEVLFAAGKEMASESAKEEPFDEQVRQYVITAMKYLGEIKK